METSSKHKKEYGGDEAVLNPSPTHFSGGMFPHSEYCQLYSSHIFPGFLGVHAPGIGTGPTLSSTPSPLSPSFYPSQPKCTCQDVYHHHHLPLEKLIWEAATRGNLQELDQLLEQGVKHGADVNWGDEDFQRTALYRAAGHGRAACINRLLQHPNINPNQVQKEGATPIFIAAQEGHIQAVEILLQDPRVNVNLTRRGGYTPFYIACDRNRVDLVRKMVNNPRVDILKKSDEGASPFLIACERGHIEIVRILLARIRMAEDLNDPKNDLATPFFLASQNGQVEVVKLLLQDGRIIPNKEKYDGVTPLGIAIHQGHLNVVKWILAASNSQLSLPSSEFMMAAKEKGYSQICSLMDQYIRQPTETKRQLQVELGITQFNAAKLFALVISVSDDYLVLCRDKLHYESKSKKIRFLQITQKLPIELQMLVCNRSYGLSKDLIPSALFEPAFIQIL